MKIILFLSSLLILTLTFGQDSIFSWKENFRIVENTISGWNVDAFGNLIVSNSSSLNKYNSDGELSYRISSKSFGEIKQIIPITPLKIVLFSEQQQQICFVDNTLTPVNECIDLGDYNIEFATFIGRSSRGELLWVFDQVNSTLLLIDLNQSGKIVQEIRNTKGLISLNDLVEIIEFQSDLLLFDSTGQLLKFDLNGSLLSQVKLDCNDISASENSIWLLNKKQLFIYSDFDNPRYVCELPITKIECFRTNSNRFFFQQNNEIQCYNLVKKK
jgi:hypothetical protein